MRPPPAVILGRPLRRAVDGHSDDLATAGLGIEGLRGAPPAFAEPTAPTTTELRRRAIYQAYRSLVDVTDGGGFGRLYGLRAGERVAGVEYLVAIETPDGRGRTTACLQIPDSFDPRRPALLAVASSGSRGIYGALPTVGEWGLRHGMAVVHTDKGTGNGIWDVDRHRGYLIDGRLSADPSDPLQTFVPEGGSALSALGARAPHTLLFKHAHSTLNVESRWGIYLLQAIEAALALLSDERQPGGPRYTAENTLILAAGISNGGATVLRALEADGGATIDGAVVSEPNAVVGNRHGRFGLKSNGVVLEAEAFGLYDYSNLHYLLQPAAVLAERDPSAPFAAQTDAARGRLTQWCTGLQQAGLLPDTDLAGAALAARQMLLDAGILEEALALGHFNVAVGQWSAVMTTYAAAYARLKPWEQPYGLGFAAVDASGLPRPLTDAEAALAWCDSSGIPPTAAVTLVAEGADGVRRATPEGTLALALALAPDRVLARSRKPVPLPAEREAMIARIVEGHAATVMNASIGERPVVMLHGRADGLIPVNHASRPYYAAHQGGTSPGGLRYYEVVHGQHFDALLGLPGFGERYVPMQAYIGDALASVYARLTGGEALAPSQVLRSRPRAMGSGSPEPLSRAHLGALRADPGADAITFDGRILDVPA